MPGGQPTSRWFATAYCPVFGEGVADILHALHQKDID
jgi:hypothetical protein